MKRYILKSRDVVHGIKMTKSRYKQTAAIFVLLVCCCSVIYLTPEGMRHILPQGVFAGLEDSGRGAHILLTNTLPSNARVFPYIGNGHLAAVVLQETVHMNGLYTGKLGNSHRARIPNWANIRVISTQHNIEYSLDTKKGVFRVWLREEGLVVSQRVYAHRYYTRAIVNQFKVANYPYGLNWQSDKKIALKLMPGATSAHINFRDNTQEVINNRAIWSTCGHIKEPEDNEYQPCLVEVCVYWTSVPEYLAAPEHGSRMYTFVMTADKNSTIARDELIQVLQEDHEVLFEKHVDQWKKLYQQGNMDIEGNLELAKLVNSIWYYILSSLPAEGPHRPVDRFYGLSPGGLATGGGIHQDYQGHSFWDSETWMFPPILLLYPRYAQELLQYRLQNGHAAHAYANRTGYRGYRFPWESAYTGKDVTPVCCFAKLEQHISGCIAFAARQFLATTRDERWLKHGGGNLITNIAEFWASRVTFNYKTGLYDIKDVIGPDEDHSNVHNSVFTNVIAGYSLYLAQYVSCLCKSNYMVTDPVDHYANVAWKLALPYDETLDYHPQYEGYPRGDTIKQADAVLLGFPLQYPMNLSTRANDLSYYETVTRSSGPAMTWSMHTIGYLQLEDDEKASTTFKKSYQDYVWEPFKVWSEMKMPDIGATNFLTGMGGFLQTLIFGYAGVSIHLDRLEIKRPRLPPDTTRFKIQGIKYLGASLTLDIGRYSTSLEVYSVDEKWPLTVFEGRHNVTLVAGKTVSLKGDGPFPIRSTPWKDCKLPADLIGNKNERPK